MDGARNPELQRLLDTLSGYTPEGVWSRGNASVNGSSSTLHTAQRTPGQSQESAIPGLSFLSPEAPSFSSPSTNLTTATPKPPIPRTSTPVRDTHTAPQPRCLTPAPDASTITTWPAAIKHIAKHLAPNETIANRIRHLISSQHSHEQQWYDGRTALISVQSSRSSTSAQVSALLHSISGRSVEAQASDKLSNEKELDAYDKKVYAGLMAMAADFDRQLRGLGVPFYAIKHELVILEDGKEKAGAMKGRLDKGELRELQKRMLAHLEDLFGSEP